ncbi:MAG TPA: LemA family protein [Burkholderiales bacterium]|jgi:LemA protein|nr:LemA family protein [Burkholderiales bacterium]
MRKLLISLVTVLSLSGCGYNEFQRQDEAVKAAWSEVINNYQRRADLIPNLVATVQGAADFEKSTLVELTNARASVGSIKATPELLNDPEAFAKFQAAQSQMTGALSRLLAVAENYPQLTATKEFGELRVELAGAENRIAVARGRYIKAVQEYNVLTRQFPTNLTAMLFGYKVKPNFTVENEKAIAVPPKVEFGKPAAK